MRTFGESTLSRGWVQPTLSRPTTVVHQQGCPHPHGCTHPPRVYASATHPHNGGKVNDPVSLLQAALETIDKLSVEEQEVLLEVAHRRLIERRRVELAQEVAQAREAYRLGHVRRGTVQDLMAESTA